MDPNPHIEEIQRQLGFAGRDVDGRRGGMTNAALLAAADEGRVTVSPPLVVIKPAEPSDLPEDGVEKLDGVHKALAAVTYAAAIRSDVPFTVIEGLRPPARSSLLPPAPARPTTAAT